MESINSEYSTINDDFSVKSLQDLSPIDITLHPIYRNDGMMLVNRYTLLMPYLLNQIRGHLKCDVPIPVIVASSDEQLNNFLNNETYSNPEFVMLLDNIVNQSIHNYTVPLSLDLYVDERVDLKAIFNLTDKINFINQRDKIKVLKDDPNINLVSQNINKYSILAKIASSTPQWGLFDQRLENKHLQDKAITMKKKFLNILNEDTSLIELANKMSLYDDLLLRHGMNVTCFSILLGLTNGLSDEDMLNLVITALFCNIGFINIEKNIFYNYLKGDIYGGVISDHIKKSLEIISLSPFCRNKSIIFGILDHYEYFNGSGNPAGKKGKNINIFGRIISIALEYDRLVNTYFEEQRLGSFIAENIIIENKEKKFDQEIIDKFINHNR